MSGPAVPDPDQGYTPSAAVVLALGLPRTAEVGQRIPKKLLLDNGAPTGADKRLIETHVQELFWHATLKPQTVAVPEYTTPTQIYTELAVLGLTLRGVTPESSKAARLTELVHRAIPYPLLLISAAPSALTVGVSAAHKRRSQAAGEQVVLEDQPHTAFLNGPPLALLVPGAVDTARAAYLDALNIAAPPAAHLYALYDRWTRAGLAYQAAQLTGRFALPAEAKVVALLLEEYRQHERESKQLRTQAGRENQLNRRAELNLKIRALEQLQTALRAKL